jgi:dTDP-glucose 4,6-dehydratase
MSDRRVLVTGAAGFIGSHLVDRYLAAGDTVVGLDNLSSGRMRNLAAASSNSRFTFVKADLCDPIEWVGPLDLILNFASPASPPRYSALSIETLRVGSLGMEQALRLAERTGARVLHASTSEVYGDPLVHPQTENYWGHVNPVGPRSMYDESKRFAEALCTAYRASRNVDVALVRIFNTYGPRLDPTDGRVVSNFIRQALAGEPMSIFGDGTQTRSFCFVDDEVRGIMALADSNETGPINIGNPNEFTMLELADLVHELTGSVAGIEFHPLPGDDPSQRQPDITLARTLLGWEPTVQLRDGLDATIRWMRREELAARLWESSDAALVGLTSSAPAGRSDREF